MLSQDEVKLERGVPSNLIKDKGGVSGDQVKAKVGRGGIVGGPD